MSYVFSATFIVHRTVNNIFIDCKSDFINMLLEYAYPTLKEIKIILLSICTNKIIFINEH